MKLLCLVAIVGWGAASAFADAQGVAPTNQTPARLVLAKPKTLAPIQRVLPQKKTRLPSTPGTNTGQVLTLLSRTNASPGAPEPLKPGVYQTLPYTCLVIVPGPCPDDKSIIGKQGDGSMSPMPVIKPDLQLIPWSAKK
jgi:hypothetical protein